MAFPSPAELLYSMQSEMGTATGTHLDANFDEIISVLNATLEQLQLIQRDDGDVRNQTVHANAFTSDALALMAGAGSPSDVDWRPRGDWVTATLYEIGNIVETGSPAVAYVCSVQHVSGTFATDYAAGKWVVLSSPRTLNSADVTTALGFTPVNRAGDTMQGALTLTTGSVLGGAAGMTISDTLIGTQDLLTVDKGLYVAYDTSVVNLAYGFAANVVRTAGDFITVGAQCSAIGQIAGGTEAMFGSNFNGIGLSGFTGYLWAQELDIGSFNPNNDKFKYGLNLVFKNRGDGLTNPGQYSYTFPFGSYSSAGGGLGNNYYNKLAKAIVIESQSRSSTGEFSGWTRGIEFGEYALDAERDTAYPSSTAYPIGINFSGMHYYGGTDPVTSFRLEAAIALRDFQTIWWNRDPATASSGLNKVKTYFNPAVTRWIIENGGVERFGVDVSTGSIYANGALFSTVSLSSNNTWTGTNTFNNNVSIGDDLGFTGLARRITGDFSNATVSNRVLVQTSTLNQATEFGLIPNGSGNGSGIYCLASPLAINTQVMRMSVSTGEAQIASSVVGGGMLVPMTFYIGPSEVMRLDEGTLQLLIGTNTEIVGPPVKLRVNGIIYCDNPVAFSVHRNAVAQNIANNTPTAINFTTEVFDTNGSYDTGTDRFTPPVGKYMLTGTVNAAGAAPTGVIAVSIYKNGAVEKTGGLSLLNAANAGASVSCIVDANGTDYFQLFVTQVTGAAMDVSGLAQDTWFQGHRIG